MKKIFIIIAFIPLVVQSQTWYPIGASWYYNFQAQTDFSAHGYIKYTVVADTLVDTKPSKLIERKTVNYLGNIISTSFLIVREENAKVYYYNNNSFDLMYDFTLNVGDTIAINLNSIMCDSVSPLIVDSIKTINISGINLKIQKVKGIYYYANPWQGIIDTISFTLLEKIGYDNFCMANNPSFIFNPQCSMVDEFGWNGLRCYIDNDIYYKSCYWDTHFNDVACDSCINTETGINISTSEINVNVYPNPTNDFLNIHTNIISKKIENIKLYSYCGKLIFQANPMLDNFVIDLKHYKGGIYLLECILENDYREFFKIIKH